LIHGLVPVIYGDVIFDSIRGGTIFSTEEQFEFLAAEFEPEKILLAGVELECGKIILIARNPPGHHPCNHQQPE
jgi:hypothetical protein